MRRVRITGPARRDIANALQRSYQDFGRQARERYRRLFDRALEDLREDPNRIGVRAIDDVREGYLVYHLKSSLKRASRPAVRRPRHVIAFFVEISGDVIVARIFHERQLLTRHLSDEDGLG